GEDTLVIGSGSKTGNRSQDFENIREFVYRL
ncbi:unnamed protein product, partial [marine sediment metagenome]